MKVYGGRKGKRRKWIKLYPSKVTYNPKQAANLMGERGAIRKEADGGHRRDIEEDWANPKE
jgi:hypothetical protein